MSHQYSLFTDVCARNHGGDRNSIEAHVSVVATKTEMHGRILALIRSLGRRGATCEEIEGALDLSHQTASARISELVRDGRLLRSGSKRPTTSGRLAHVHTVYV